MLRDRPTDQPTFSLDSFDVEPPLPRLEATILATTGGDKRDDLVWAHVSQAIQVGPNRWLAEPLMIEKIVLGSRQKGSTIAEGPWPIHV